MTEMQYLVLHPQPLLPVDRCAKKCIGPNQIEHFWLMQMLGNFLSK